MFQREYNYICNYNTFNITHLLSAEDYLHTSTPHIHNMCELLLVEEGISTLITKDSVLHGEGRFLIFIPGECIHEQINDPSTPYRRYCFPFDSRFVGTEALALPTEPFILDLNNEHYPVIEIIVSAMYRLYTVQQNELGGEKLKHLLLMLFGELQPFFVNSEGFDRNHSIASSRKRYIGDVCLYINQHLYENILIDELAEAFFVSRSKLSRDFSDIMRMSIIDYIVITRLNRSKPLLTSGVPIGEIAVRCGFSSTSYYTRSFRDKFGQSPSDYRKLRKATND